MSAEQAVVPPDAEVPARDVTPEVVQPEQSADAAVTPPPEDAQTKESVKVVRSVQKRLDEMTRMSNDAVRAAQQETGLWQRQAYEADQKLQALHMQTSEPTLENSGNDIEKYIARKTQWEAARQTSAMLAQQVQQNQAAMRYQQQIAAQQQAAAAQQVFVAGKMQEGDKLYPDFSKVVGNPELPQLMNVNRPAFDAILQSEKGLDVAYHLAKNPLLAHQVAMAPPLQAVLMIGQIAGMFSAGKQVSNAPPPPATVHGNSAPSKPGSETMDQYVKRRQKEIAASR